MMMVIHAYLLRGKFFLLTNLTLVPMQLNSDLLSKVSGSNPVDGKNLVERGDSINLLKCGHPDSSMEISLLKFCFYMVELLKIYIIGTFVL